MSFTPRRRRFALSFAGATSGSRNTISPSLRLLGTVGEPINPEAWMWYHKVIGRGRCPIVDTWWQTETGAIMITPLPGAIATKPGSSNLALFRQLTRRSLMNAGTKSARMLAAS